MKTLYISDLDGTLLNSNAMLSDYTEKTLNKLICAGAYFSVATARTAATTLFMIERVGVNIPIVLMNGVLIYDIQRRKYTKKELLHKTCVAQILDATKKTGQEGLMYALSGNEMVTYYECVDNTPLKNFVEERERKYNKKFTQIDDFAKADTDIIYFCFLDDCDKIKRLYDEVKQIKGIRIYTYRDVYNKDLWYLEILSDTASKKNAVQFLRQEYNFDRVVGFGDNLNDFALFEACDECYAVANAVEELKAVATAVIGSNTEDGVAHWLRGNLT